MKDNKTSTVQYSDTANTKAKYHKYKSQILRVQSPVASYKGIGKMTIIKGKQIKSCFIL